MRHGSWTVDRRDHTTSSAPADRGSQRRLRPADVAGGTLFAGSITWALLAGSRGSPEPLAALLAGSALVFVAARLLTRLARPAVPALVVIVATGVAFVSREDLVAGGPLTGLFGYTNAKGAFFMLAAFAGLMVAAGTSRWGLRVAAVAVAAGAGVVPLSSRVLTSSVLLIVLGVFAITVGWIGARTARVAIGLAGGLFVLAFVTTGILGLRGPAGTRSGLASSLEEALSDDRVVLWHEAEQLMADEPLYGVGPGRFRYESAFARENAGNLYFWAHNDFLQQGAELGVPGLVLSVALILWGFVALWSNPRTDAFVALGAAALAAVAIQACVDYVLHFPGVTLTAAALVGAATGTPSRAHSFRGGWVSQR